MAQDGLFLPGVARVHPRLGTPVRATAVQAALACALVLAGTFDDILGYFIFPTVAFLGLTAAALFVLQRSSAAPAPVRSGYPFTPVAFLVLVAVLLALLALGNPVGSLIGSGVVALGLPVSFLVVRPASATRISDHP
jgi:APA family basic amino acid/polyamine antiporter